MSDTKKTVTRPGVEQFKAELAAKQGPTGPLEQALHVKRKDVDARPAALRTNDKKQEELREMENQLLEKALDNMAHAQNFATIPFGPDEKDEDGELKIPNDLREKYGDRAMEVYMLMRVAQLPNSQVPSGLLLSAKMATSIIKARATEKGAPRQLNMAVQIVTSAPQFEIIEVEQ